MKLFLIIVLLIVQLLLIIFSHYAEYIASIELQALSTDSLSETLIRINTYQRYNALDNNLGHSAGALWIINIIIINLKKMVKTTLVKLSVLLPIFVNILLSLVQLAL